MIYAVVSVVIGALLYVASGLAYSASNRAVAAFQWADILLVFGAIWLSSTGRYGFVVGVWLLMLALFWWLRS